MKQRLDPRRVQAALVCMHFDPAYAAEVRGARPLAELAPRERALLRDLDPRALATDHYRRARAVQALLDEYPVSAAVLGVPAVDAFFSTPAFRACVFEPGSMALAFGTWLGHQADGPGQIEAAIARVRRPSPAPGPGIACAPRLAPLLAPEGSLAFYEATRAALGPDPVAALAAAGLPTREPPPRSQRREALLVEADAAGAIALGGASEPLVRLLLFAARARPRDALAREAVRLGAAPGEAAELLDSLLAEGLLVAT